MKSTRVYIATDEYAEFNEKVNEPEVYEKEEDVIAFCKKKNEENKDEHWCWEEADFHCCTRSKFTFKIGSEERVLTAYQSPRGLRIKDKRPERIKIEVNEEFDLIGLLRHIEYLKTLSLAMN